MPHADVPPEPVKRINDIEYDLICETALILDAKYVHKNGVNNNDKAAQPGEYKKGDKQKVYAVPCQLEIQTQEQFHAVHQSYYQQKQAYTPDMLDENGRKIRKIYYSVPLGSSKPFNKKRKTETKPREPRDPYNKTKIQCACDGCNKMISAKLAALKGHHNNHHNALLSYPALRELYKGKFMEDMCPVSNE